jgi:hypothetical protein
VAVPGLAACVTATVIGTNLVTFTRHPHADERKKSAAVLVKLLLANRTSDVLPAHLKRLLSELLWKITEAESAKYETRYQSQGAIEGKGRLQHDHVYQRQKMIAALLEASPQEVDEILDAAVGCTVTVEEHHRLKAFDHEYGWERYRKAEVLVIDTASGERLV